MKEALGQAIIDRIASRTEAGAGVKFGPSGQGRSVKLKSPYSKEYANSLEFKAAGKSKTKVNMTLTGDMLASLDVTVGSRGELTILVSDDQVPKAFNHITGDTVPDRPWFGVTKTEVKTLLKDFAPDIKAAQIDTNDEAPDRATRIKAIDILNGGDGEDDGGD